MVGRVGGRIGQLGLLWLALTAILFALLHAMPGSPEELLLATNPDLVGEDVERVRHLRGLDLPAATRYRCWLLGRSAACPGWPTERGLLAGELGWSVRHRASVADLVSRRLLNTLWLMGPTLVLALLGAVLLGTRAALRPGGPSDRVARAVASLGLAMPAHWLGLLVILTFAVGLGWLPAGGVQSLHAPGAASRAVHLVLPVSVLATYYLARWTRYVRRAMRAELGAPHLDTARSLGMSERAVIWQVALPGALFPLATVVAQSTPVLFSGALVIERVFAYPGMGLLIFESVEGHDYLVAITVFCVYAAVTFAASGLADALYFVLDPRARRPEGGR